MKERLKSTKTFNDFNSQFSCRKHPYHSSYSCVGICPLCLNERLEKLVCSDCGERRASSCSCSEISSSYLYRNSCSYVDVGRISFLIDSHKTYHKRPSFLRSRSSSSKGVETNKSDGFWRIKRLFTKRSMNNKGFPVPDENCEMMGSSRNADEQYYGARRGGFSDILYDGSDGFGLKKVGRNGCANQMEIEGACSVFPMKERDGDEMGFIELKLNSSYNRELCGGTGRASYDGDGVGASLRGNGGGGSCRITMSERGGLKQGSRNWRWIPRFR